MTYFSSLDKMKHEESAWQNLDRLGVNNTRVLSKILLVIFVYIVLYSVYPLHNALVAF